MSNERDDFDVVNDSVLDEVGEMTPDQINAKIREEQSGGQQHTETQRPAREPESDDQDISSALDLDDVVGALTGRRGPEKQPAEQPQIVEPSEPGPSKGESETAKLREELANMRTQYNSLVEKVLERGQPVQEQGQGESDESLHTIDDIDPTNRDYFKPLYQPGMEAAEKVRLLEQQLSELQPLVQDARTRKFGNYLATNVNGFKADMMPAFMSWVEKQPEEIRDRYGSQDAGALGAEILAERYLRSGGAAGGAARTRPHPMASQAVSDMGGDSPDTGERKGPSYEQLMELDDESWGKINARLEAEM